MDIRKCKECGHDISSIAKKCPNCGMHIKKRFDCISLICIAIICIIPLIAFVLMISDKLDSIKTETAINLDREN